MATTGSGWWMKTPNGGVCHNNLSEGRWLRTGWWRSYSSWLNGRLRFSMQSMMSWCTISLPWIPTQRPPWPASSCSTAKAPMRLDMMRSRAVARNRHAGCGPGWWRGFRGPSWPRCLCQGVDVGDVLADGDDGVLLALGFAFLICCSSFSLSRPLPARSRTRRHRPRQRTWPDRRSGGP